MIFQNSLIIEPQSQNPWKIVFKVLKYAATHKHPENRSALTYCEDPPSRMDLGKNRYGGPYTTEEVEDVKTFLHIMAVILSLSVSLISFYLCTFSDGSLLRMLKGVDNLNTYSYNAIQFSYSTTVLTCLYIPFYEFVIYPFVRNRVPTMLKSIVISAFGLIVMSIYLLTIDIAGHYSSGHNITCIFNETQNENIEMLPVNFAVLNIPFQILLASINLLLLTSTFQFICAQAPYSMKGLLTGLAFLVVYFSWCVADVVQAGFQNKWEHRYYSVKSLTISCDFWYFITTLLISIAGLVIISFVAKWYKKREREDPNNDRMFVEAYYESSLPIQVEREGMSFSTTDHGHSDMANGILFAMDQMPAASGEQVSALINWYIWASYLGQSFGTLGIIVFNGNGQTQIYVLIAVLTILTIAISCGMVFHNNFTIEPQSRNPWKIVFNVLKYAATHKHPENRSALTYCEDPPSRMDLGKNRYGGPYTTEEVEDVKTFFRIMAVILSVTLSFTAYYLCGFSNENLFGMLKGAGNPNSLTSNAIRFSYNWNVLIGLYIPLYEFVIYPFIRNRVPPMLKRIVISTFGLIIMCIYLLTIDIAGHYRGGQNITCIFNETQVEIIEILPVNFAVLSVPFQILMSSVALLYEVAIFQFICAQAPYSMKGLLIGLGFLVMFFSGCIADVIRLGFHKKWKHRYYSKKSLTSSCDFRYFITTLIISIVGMVIISLVAKWYKKREREDPHNDRTFVEAYYDKYCVNSDEKFVDHSQ